MEVSWLVEVAGVARIAQLHDGMVRQLAEMPQSLQSQDSVQFPIEDESRGLQSKAGAVTCTPYRADPQAASSGSLPQTPQYFDPDQEWDRAPCK